MADTGMGDPDALAAEGSLSIDDAAKFLGIGRTAVYDLMADGKLRSIKIGARRLLLRAELRRFLAARIEQA